MLPLTPLTHALPLAVLALLLGAPWPGRIGARVAALASAFAIGAGFLVARGAASGWPAWPARDASQRLWWAVAAALVLAPLELARARSADALERPSLARRGWPALAWIALVVALAWIAMRPLARARGFDALRTAGVLGAAAIGLVLARAGAAWLERRHPRGPLVASAFGIALLASAVAIADAGSVGLATGIAGAAVGASCVALLARLRRDRELARASAGVLAMTHAGALAIALWIVPGLSIPAAVLLVLAPWAAALPLGDPTRDRGWVLRCVAVLAAGAAAVALVLAREGSSY